LDLIITIEAKNSQNLVESRKYVKFQGMKLYLKRLNILDIIISKIKL